MDQVKIGEFLKELRLEKKLTQSELADKLFVSNKSVSRWERGSNLPDIDILIELSRLYGVGLEEILDGQRKDMTTDKIESTALKVAELSSDEQRHLTKNIQIIFIAGLITMTINMLMERFVITDDPIIRFIHGFFEGFSYGTIIVGVIFTSKWALKLNEFKRRIKKKED